MKKVDMDKIKYDTSQVEKAQEEEKKEQSVYKITLTKAQRDELVERVCYLVDKDEGDWKEYIDKRRKVRDMYEAKRAPKVDPWVNCANVSTQLVNMSVELLHSRLFPSAWNENMLYWKPMEKNDVDNIENVNKFMGWAVRDIKLSSVIDDGTHNTIMDGTVVYKVRWVNDWRWIQRKIRRKESQKNKIRNIVLRFIGGTRRIKEEEVKYDITYEYKKFESCKVEVCDLEDIGFPLYQSPNCREEDLEYIWHRTYPTYSELTELAAMGYYENVDEIGTYLEEIMISGTKKANIDAENTKITQNKYNHKCEIIEFYDKYDVNNDGVREDIIITVDRKSKTIIDCKSLLAYSRFNERPFVIGQFIRRPNRMLGKGAGEIAVPFEEEANAIHNQRLDAGTMSIIPFGVYRAGSGFKPENIEMAPGLWVPVDDINDAKWITVANNVMVSFQEERMLMELLEKILSVGSYQSGQESDVNRSRSTARGTLAIIQQGDIRFAILARRIQLPITRILNKVLHQYQDKIPPGLAVRVLGEDGTELFPEGIAPEDLAGSYDAYMTLDYTGGSKDTDRQVKQMVYQYMMQNPFILRNPAGLWQISADVLTASGYEDIERYLGPKPVQQNLSRDVMEENVLMLQGKKVQTHDTDNVIEHLMGHYAFKDSPEYMIMPPEYRMNFEDHLEATKLQIGTAFQKMAQEQMQPQQQMGQMGQMGQQVPRPEGMINGNPEGTAMGVNPQQGMANAGGTPEGMPGAAPQEGVV